MTFDTDSSEPQPRATEPLADPGRHRNVAITIVAVAAAILLAQYMRDVLIPFVLAGLLFYALDPLVDWLARLRVPRPLGAAVAILLLCSCVGVGVYSLRDDAMRVVEELPAAARRVRANWAAENGGAPTALEKVQDAAREIEGLAEEAAATPEGNSAPPGVERVQIEQPTFRMFDYVWWTSIGALTLLGQASLVLFLAYFLLVYDDLFKRKLVESVGSLADKKITVQILNEIATQIERFLLVQIFTSIVVGVATGLAFWWMGLSYPGFWGVAAGVFNVIPYVGPLIVASAVGLAGYLQFESMQSALGFAGVAMLITTIEGYWLTPMLMRKVADMNRIAIFVGLLFWSWLWGIPGMLLAIPMMVVIKAVCDRVEGLQPVGSMLGE